MENRNTLKWRFDVNTFRLLGRDLITDRITALFELVKNCYDANAKNVSISFVNVGNKENFSKIIIADDGIGMSLEDIENKWMVIGTSSKRNELYSPEPFHRRYIGEKGIGRFAVDKLGQYVNIKTKQANDEKELVVTINWQTYENLAQEQKTSHLFTDIENEYDYITPTFQQGTHLEILLPREIWTLEDVNRTEKELSRLVSPFHTSKFPFEIFIHAPEYTPYEEPVKVETKEKDFSSHNFKLEFDTKTQTQDALYFNKITQKIEIIKKEKPSFGFIKFYLYYFDAVAKAQFNAFYKKTATNIDGVKIYRDGILTTPFAEYESKDEKRRDVLGINKRRWINTFDRIGTRDVIGYIEITRNDNPNILDTTNRQDFLSTPEYSELKDFIYEQLDIFMETYKMERAERKEKSLSSFETSKNALVSIQKEMTKLQKTRDTEKQAEVVHKILTEVERLQTGFEAISIEYKTAEQEKNWVEGEKNRREKIFYSLLSQSMFAINMGHTLRDNIKNIKDRAAYMANEPLVNDESIAIVKRYAGNIYSEITSLLPIIDFMLSGAKTNLPADNFDMKTAIESVFEAHKFFFEEKRVNITLNLQANIFLFANEILFKDIITCLISNAVKAIEPFRDRKIHCSLNVKENHIILLFSDNGIGIPEEKWEWVFGLYNTTTEAKGGVGVGLHIVKKNIEELNGRVFIIENTHFPQGTTVCVSIPS